MSQDWQVQDNIRSMEIKGNLPRWQDAKRGVIALVSFRNEQNYEDHAAVLLSAKWGVIGFVPAGYIVVIADVVHLYVL